VPAIEGVDTRALTRRLREHGTMSGCLLEKGERFEDGRDLDAVDMDRVVELVAPSDVVEYPAGDLRILAIDTGAKEGIFRALQARGASIVRAPFNRDWERYLPDVDAVVLTNGPGDPTSLQPLVERLRSSILAKGIPTFGICLGHQLLALAAGARTYKLKYGHRSQNQPVVDRVTSRAYVTSQNHGYAVDESLPADWLPWFVNLNDGSNEGVRHAYRPFLSVQFHPEAAAGPRDTAFLFDDFLRMAGEIRKGRRDEGHRTRLRTIST
jgi:carbamoyl-phosphate synthase small subunit